MRLTLAQVLEATRGELVLDAGPQGFSGVSVDSRTTAPGELFVAIRGAIRDGHDFVNDVCRRQAAGLIVDRWPLPNFPAEAELDVVKVEDSLYALGEVARSIRRELQNRVVAITGTAGKTTTKEMVVEVLRAAVGPVFQHPPGASERSENNLVGLPVTLFRLAGTEPVVVLEMGMNALGEIARLTEIAAPDVGLVTNIGLAHLRPSATSLSLGDAPQPLNSLEGVIKAKGELWAGMRPDAMAVVNLDDPNVVKLAETRGGERLTYSCEASTGTTVSSEDWCPNGTDGQSFTLLIGRERAQVSLMVPGRHNLSNALAAAAICCAVGVPIGLIAKGLESFKPVKMRGEMVSLGPDIVCINDAYNANPLSMAAALRMLAELPGARRIAALGDMRELGDRAPAAHREVGALVAALEIDHLVAVGEFAKEVAAGARHGGMRAARITTLANSDELSVALRELLRSGDRVLLKASRAVSLEKALAQFNDARPR